MNELNYIKIVFAFLTMFMVFVGILLNSLEKYLPVFIIQFCRYGKFAYKGKRVSLVNKVEVPKSWFKHFYIYSSILSSAVLIFLIFVYLFDFTVPGWMFSVLDTMGGVTRQVTVSSASTLLAMFLLSVQCCRRCYDTQCISVFAKNSTMNLTYYFIGFIHYTGAVFAILMEAPKFTRSVGIEATFCWTDLSYADVTASLLFLFAWWHQYKVTVILANLRKNKKGSVVTQAHKLPHGDWFEYVSSPHLLMEILMYFSLTIILWNNITWLYVSIWVLTNQIETALLSHWWYQATFPDLPKHRKAIIPFVY